MKCDMHVDDNCEGEAEFWATLIMGDADVADVETCQTCYDTINSSPEEIRLEMQE
jgi:hypothetical protein